MSVQYDKPCLYLFLLKLQFSINIWRISISNVSGCFGYLSLGYLYLELFWLQKVCNILRSWLLLVDVTSTERLPGARLDMRKMLKLSLKLTKVQKKLTYMVCYFSEGGILLWMENSQTPSKKTSRHVNYFIKTSITWENENICSNFIYYTFIGTVTEEDNSD